MTKPIPKHLHKKKGRKLFDGQDEQIVLSKMRAAWDIGASDVEAAVHANIATSTYYRYIEDHPALKEEMKERRRKPILLARSVVMGALKNQDSHTAKWYLERKRKHEFSTLQRTENINRNLNAEEEAKALADLTKEADAIDDTE